MPDAVQKKINPTPDCFNNGTSTRTACFRCRSIRHSCDRKKPSCSRCKQKGFSCSYPEHAPTLKRLQELTMTLSKRVEYFQELLEKQQKQQEQQQQHRKIITGGRKKQQQLTYQNNVFPCQKCYQSLQPCDMTLPGCKRCQQNGVECTYYYDEKPKIYHIATAVSKLNAMMDKYEHVLRQEEKIQQRKTIWSVLSTNQGCTGIANIASYNDLLKLIDHINQFNMLSNNKNSHDYQQQQHESSFTSILLGEPWKLPPLSSISLSSSSSESESSISTTTTATTTTTSSKQNRMEKCPFAVWDAWSYPNHPSMPRDYPIEITDQLTNDLLDLYCRTPCCSAFRLPIIDTEEFMARYKGESTTVTSPPAKVLVYAICAMTARNAFQVHVWNKKTRYNNNNNNNNNNNFMEGGYGGGPAHFNMGKALSMAYCLEARELLADCFDEPSLDTCRAAILLSYCSYQNGYSGLIYYYEFIAVSMAHDLGLYNGMSTLKMTPYDNVLAWSLYYFHIWGQLLRGGSARLAGGWNSPPSLLSLPQPPERHHRDYYLLSNWAYKIQLQTQRDAVMASILFAQQQGLSAQELADLLQPKQKQLDNSNATLGHTMLMDDRYTTDVDILVLSCILELQVQYNINKILLHYPFLTTPNPPSTAVLSSHLEICMHAANAITCLIEASADGCNCPLIGLVFANSVYLKYWRYTKSQFALRCLKRSVDISKSTTTYVHDFEMAKTLVHIMEAHVETMTIS
ncbi:hypothetical protein BDA99DRAFT_467511 [Phascolomyces articulosus]|uniref:Zn(2)-C6 fungal-type domain-containing protein n=1 Tax=Phascolomyces articulosus TaxID=60185 RepID=A0AAD5K866_9FUNG|nr:hypothetical protein BDA99DRAFT_467511 [Phascolomyces articulosus]